MFFWKTALTRTQLAAVEQEITCPLTHEASVDAVILSCGHSFSDDALEKAEDMLNGACPYACVTDRPTPRIPNVALREIAAKFAALCPDGVADAPEDAVNELRQQFKGRRNFPKQFDLHLAQTLMGPHVGFAGAMNRNSTILASACAISALVLAHHEGKPDLIFMVAGGVLVLGALFALRAIAALEREELDMARRQRMVEENLLAQLAQQREELDAQLERIIDANRRALMQHARW